MEGSYFPDFEVQSYDNLFAKTEYPTQRGSIDIVVVNSHADIFLIETKLFRNPESHRVVVAQAIDYAKSFSEENSKTLIKKFDNSNYFNKLKMIPKTPSPVSQKIKTLSGQVALRVKGPKRITKLATESVPVKNR